MPTIDPDKVCHVIVKARALSAKTDVGSVDDASNMIDDDMLEVLEEGVDDATDQELMEFIEGLNIDEQIELVALAWIGRGSFTRDEWSEGPARLAKHQPAKLVLSPLVESPRSIHPA